MDCATVMWQQCEEILNSGVVGARGIEFRNGKETALLILLALFAGREKASCSP